MDQAFCIGPGTRVSVSYTVLDEDGDVVDASPPNEPLIYIHGFGQVIPGLERHIEGLRPGQAREFTLPPEEGYGDHDPDNLFQVPRSEFPDPAAVEVDDEYLVDGPDGEELLLRVVEFIDDQHVLVDANHPLAGATLSFLVTVEQVRPATDAELEEAERALVEQEGGEPEPSLGGGLIQLGRKPRGGEPS